MVRVKDGWYEPVILVHRTAKNAILQFMVADHFWVSYRVTGDVVTRVAKAINLPLDSPQNYMRLDGCCIQIYIKANKPSGFRQTKLNASF